MPHFSGWYALLAAITGELIVPLLLAPFYRGYRPTRTALSVLGCARSPVRRVYNTWMLVAGLLFLYAAPGIYSTYQEALGLATAVCLGAFAVGACLFTCFFPCSETKEELDTATKLHGAGSVIGFMLLLLTPALLAILLFRTGDWRGTVLCGGSFLLALAAFVLFVMADKPRFQGTVIAKEGLWQRLNLLFMYLPMAYIAAVQLGLL